MAGRASCVLALATHLAVAASVWPTEREALTVSPGGLAQALAVAEVCPTFSWSASDGGLGYDLAIYTVGEEGRLEPFLEVTIPGAATSFTPAPPRCLLPGDTYAWAVRSKSVEGEGEW